MESIHLIPQDLRRGEMIIQVADLLTSLEKSAQDIFSRVDSRVKELSRELKDIDQRVEVAKSQVDSLKQFKNRGVRIYSTGKYPSKHEIGVQDYQPIARNPVDQGRQEDAEKKTVRGIHIPFSEEVVLEKLQFYQYRGKGRINPLQQQTSQEDQVPSVPWERLTHVASLVRFNSSQNPFLSRGKSSSATDQKTRKKHHLDEDEADISQPAPASMSRIDEEDDPDSFFKYNPELNAAPTLIDELPAALPDLDGIASDMFFSADEALGGSSMFFAEPVSAINQQQTGFGRPVQKNQEVVDTKKKQDISQRPTTAPVEQKSFSFSSSSQSVKTEPVIAPPPPPPSSEPLVSKLEVLQPSSVPLSSADGGRASLLESIRNAAGKPKKGQVTAKDLKIEKKKKRQEEMAVSGDLMGDLMASLRARRIGISGGNEQPAPRTSTPIPSTTATTSTEPASSALLRVSSMIPPPPPTSAPAGYSDDEDWD